MYLLAKSNKFIEIINKYSYFKKLIFVSILVNSLTGNLFNLNSTQPYYVCNLLATILLCYTLSNEGIIKDKKFQI